MNLRYVLALGLTITCVAISSAFAEEVDNLSGGPIELRDQHPLALLHLSMLPESPEVANHGELDARLSFAWSNTLNRRRSTYLIDAETRVTEAAVHYGITPGMQLELAVPVIYRGQGILDPLLDDWHKLFHLPRGKRDKVDDNGFSLSGRNDDGSEFDLEGDGTKIGNVQVGTKVLLTEGTEALPAWAVALRLTLPTAPGSYGSESVDIGIQLDGSKRWGNLGSFWGGSYLYYPDGKTNGLQFQPHRFGGFAGFDYRLFSWLQPYVGIVAANSLLDDVKKFPSYALYLDTGARFPLSRDWNLEILLRENPAPRDGTVDATGLIAISCRNIWG